MSRIIRGTRADQEAREASSLWDTTCVWHGCESTTWADADLPLCQRHAIRTTKETLATGGVKLTNQGDE